MIHTQIIRKMIVALLAGGIAGLLLLSLVYRIPTEPMINNARASVDIFKEEGASAQVIHGYEATTLDNYTDAWMLRNAFYNGEESAWQKSLHIYYYGYPEGETDDVCESMIAWLEGKEGYARFSYARYWHGYLVILKPLLFFLDYGDIRGVLKGFELAILLYLCVLLERRHMARFVPAFAAAMLCVEFHVIGMSMQFSWVFIIAGVSSIVILQRYRSKETEPETCLLFLVIGMCTSYFDFLTYPVFTLGIPLLFLTICTREIGERFHLLRMVCVDSVCWAVGYAGMWAQKWIWYTIFTGENLIADGVQSVMLRSGRNVMGEQTGYLETVFENLAVISKYPYAMACFAAVILLIGMSRKEKYISFSWEALMTYLYIAALPFGWYLISVNHSYIHSFMTYRGLGVTVMAVLCAVTEIWNMAGARMHSIRSGR